MYKKWTAENYLEHHGILGMKWGIRRYQNYDGTYTQAGLEHYRKKKSAFDEAEQHLKETKQRYKNGEIHAKTLDKAKNSYALAKKDLNKAYNDLKKANAADKGKELYRRGNTIDDTERKIRSMNKITGFATSAGIYATYLLGQKQLEHAVFFKDPAYLSDLSTSAKMAASVTLGASIAGAAYNVYSRHKIKTMRAYVHKSNNSKFYDKYNGK